MTALAAVLSGAVGVIAGPALAMLATQVPERAPLERPVVDRRAVVITVVTAALFTACGMRFGMAWELPAYLLFTACLVTVTVTDFERFLIPNRIVYPTLFATVPLLVLAAVGTGNGDALTRAAIGGLAAWFALLIVHLINPRGMAFGDVRLAAVIGIYTGWLGASEVFLALFLGFLSAAVVGIVLIATRLRGRKDPVPFGPFLAAGAIAVVLAGDPLLRWYSGS